MSHRLITTMEAAARLGVPHSCVLSWVAKGLLPLAGQDEDGVPLLREHIVEINGEALVSGVAESLRSRRLRRLLTDPNQPRVLACGCCFAAATGSGVDEPAFLCRTGRSLRAAADLARLFAAAAPDDAFFVRLSAVAWEALAAHLSTPPVELPPPVTRQAAE